MKIITQGMPDRVVGNATCIHCASVLELWLSDLYLQPVSDGDTDVQFKCCVCMQIKTTSLVDYTKVRAYKRALPAHGPVSED